MPSPTVVKKFDASPIIQIHRTTYKLQVNNFVNTKVKRFTITSTGVRTKLRAAVQILGKILLGFGPMEMGAHSLRSGAAMKIYLSG